MKYLLTLESGKTMEISAEHFNTWCKTRGESPSTNALVRLKQIKEYVGFNDIIDWEMVED